SGKTSNKATKEPKKAICKVSRMALRADSALSQLGGNHSSAILLKNWVDSINFSQLKLVAWPLQITRIVNNRISRRFLGLNHIICHSPILFFRFLSLPGE